MLKSVFEFQIKCSFWLWCLRVYIDMVKWALNYAQAMQVACSPLLTWNVATKMPSSSCVGRVFAYATINEWIFVHGTCAWCPGQRTARVTLANFCMPGSYSLHLGVWAVPVGLKLQHGALGLLPPKYTRCPALTSLIDGLSLRSSSLLF